MDYQVTCITRDRNDPDRSIDEFGGAFGRLTLDQLLQAIRNGHQFWVAGVGKSPSAWLEVVPASAYRRVHVRTVPDGIHDNNLYSLQPCP